ncbi:15284_t:CDS:2 [Entrophospora sp. SA101]|nr:15284_t:CDS:2 [Entrophospora sp. SA101]
MVKEENMTVLFVGTAPHLAEIVKQAAINCQFACFSAIGKICYFIQKRTGEKRPNVLLFIIGLKKEKTAIREAKRLNIPIMAICNTSADPDLVDYVIPVEYLVNAVAEVIRESKLRKDAELTAEESKSPEEAKNLHIGHLFTILQTIRFAQKGFKILLVFGGATSKIGDPSDKLKERPQLADDEIKNYYQKIEGQITDLLLKEKKPCQPGFRPLELFYSDNPVLLKDIYQIGRNISVNYLLTKETIKQRVENPETSLSFTAFSYSLLQAYDFYYLYQNYNCHGQLGGSDQ